MKTTRLVLIGAVVSTGVWLASAPPLRAADHFDSPATQSDAKVDIADVYAFVSPADANNAVLVMTVSPNGTTKDASFDDGARYELHVDNDGDNQSDYTYKIRTRGDEVRVVGNGVDIQGKIGETLTSGSVKFFAGSRDDPFFLDSSGLTATLTDATDKFTGTDALAGTNVSAFVLEVPKADLKGGGSDTTLGIWAATTR